MFLVRAIPDVLMMVLRIRRVDVRILLLAAARMRTLSRRKVPRWSVLVRLRPWLLGVMMIRGVNGRVLCIVEWLLVRMLWCGFLSGRLCINDLRRLSVLMFRCIMFLVRRNGRRRWEGVCDGCLRICGCW